MWLPFLHCPFNQAQKNASGLSALFATTVSMELTRLSWNMHACRTLEAFGVRRSALVQAGSLRCFRPELQPSKSRLAHPQCKPHDPWEQRQEGAARMSEK